MKCLAVLLCLITAALSSAKLVAQNPNYSAYYSNAFSTDQNGNVFVTPTAEVTGWDDGDDWAIGGYHPICTLSPFAEVTGDSGWVRGQTVALYQTVDYVHTGQPIQLPNDGSDVDVQFGVRVDAHCPRPSQYFTYPPVVSLSYWSNINPSNWFLWGFSPIQTNPPYSNADCWTPESCTVGYSQAYVGNFVDFADFGDSKFSIHTTYWGPPPIQTPDGTCIYSVTACAPGPPKCTAPEGFQWYFRCPAYQKA